MTITGPSGYLQTATATAVNGVASLNLSSFALTAPGTYTVTTTSPGLLTVTSTVTVTAQLVLTGVPTTMAAGGNLGTVTVSVENSSGSVVTTSAASITVTITGPNGYSQAASGTAVNGVASLNLSSFALTASGAYTVTTTSPGFPTDTSSLVVTAATAIATSTTLTASPDPLADGQSATLTATVSPAPTGTPAGTVGFYSGATLLGTAPLNASGVATFTTNSLVVGADSITAVYPGNASFAASTSSAVSETVTTSYTVTGPTTPISVAAGGSVNVNITVPPLGGAFNNVVTLSASGLPPGATATFNPPTVMPGSAGATTVMTIQLAAVAASIHARDIPANHLSLIHI